MEKLAYLAFGSNIGEAKENIRGAYEALRAVPGLRIEKVSSYYITKPWGVTDQPDFVNTCAAVRTALSPEALLGVCLGVEAGLGRIRKQKNGPRLIDIDLLLYEGETRETAELILPHPRMLERPFVLQPLLEVSDRGLCLGIDVAAALAALPEQAGAQGSVVSVEAEGRA